MPSNNNSNTITNNINLKKIQPICGEKETKISKNILRKNPYLSDKYRKEKISICNFFQEVYNYAIDVLPVHSCPNNESKWQAAAVRADCSGTRGYHCVPDKFHTRLIEFCYSKTRIFVPKGKVFSLSLKTCQS